MSDELPIASVTIITPDGGPGYEYVFEVPVGPPGPTGSAGEPGETGPPGEEYEVQNLVAERTDYFSSTATVPFDDTKPEATEGVAVLGPVTIVPTDAANIIKVTLEVGYVQTNGGGVTWIHKGGQALELKWRGGAAEAPQDPRVEYQEVAGDTSSRSFYGRIGTTGTGTLHVNGYSGARKFGGALVCRLRVREVRPPTG